jgi:hypothetical protein
VLEEKSFSDIGSPDELKLLSADPATKTWIIWAL